MAATTKKDRNEALRPWAQDVDRHIGARMRARRVLLGLTQKHVADLIGVTYQQAHKYEKGINRIAAGRLGDFARTMGVEVGYFCDEIAAKPARFNATPQQRLMLELARSFMALPSRKHQEAICTLARILANPDLLDDIDRHVGARMRQRRIMLGLTQQQLAELIGVTYQQAHTYEKGINRIAAGRLSAIAQALGVGIGYFYEGMSPTPEAVAAMPQERLLLELARSFMALPSRKHQEAICTLARILANPDLLDDIDQAMLVADAHATRT